MNARYISSRVIIGVVVGLVLMFARQVSKGQGGDYTLAGPQYMPTFLGGFYINVVNPTGSAVTVTYPGTGQKIQTIQTWPGRVTQPYSSAGSFVVPANSAYQFQMAINFTGGTAPGNWTGGPYVGITDQWAVNFTVSGVSRPWTATKSATYHARSGAVSLTPVPVVLGDFYAVDPPPSGRVTVAFDSLAAGVVSHGFSGSLASGTFAAGSHVLFTTALPATISNGAVYEVKKYGVLIGSGTVVKDGFGNFDLAFNAVGLPPAGILNVLGSVELIGSGSVKIEGETDQVMEFTEADAVDFTRTYTDGTEVADGSAVTVYIDRAAGAPSNLPPQIPVGRGRIVHNPDHSWTCNIYCRPGGADAGPGEVKFELDISSYCPGALNIVLLIDGVPFQADHTLVGGNQVTGQTTKVTAILPNETGALNDKTYEWQISGTVDGAPVAGKAVAAGRTPPETFTLVGDIGDPQRSFVMSDAATVGTARPSSDVAENDYDPEEPPPPGETPEEAEKREQKKDDYESTRKAVEDALNASGKDTTAPPSGEAGATAGRAVGDSISGASRFGDLAKESKQQGVVNWAGANTLNISLPGLGTLELDASNYGSGATVLRVLGLMALLFFYWKFSLAVARDSLAN